jgi:hypothetical protein
MRKISTILILVFITGTFSFGQNADEILEEGKLLYRLEKASWHGTDVFIEMFPHKIDEVGGYLSYLNENNQVINLFFKKENPFYILARFEFESLSQKYPIMIDTLNHIATQQETDLITIRQDAIQKVFENKDGFFSFYENTSPNPIPLIHKGKKRVFILTGPKISNVVIIGNDYLFTYNDKNKFVKKEKIHNSILQYPYKSDDPKNKVESTFHSHILSDYITSTDICTLLLYKDYVEWKQHYVISKKYVSIFDLEKESLAIITRKAWDKMNESQKNKK